VELTSAMNVTDIDICRDGGTILFTIDEPSTVSGRYRLRTPVLGEPRPIFRNETQLAFGSSDEATLTSALQCWLDSQLSPDSTAALHDLDNLHDWRNMPEWLRKVVPLYRIRTVIACLSEKRLP
jgi:hypothetical protein